jgi:CelD/BcsL family acetyltransferase involved in cellulose biosynthesis
MRIEVIDSVLRLTEIEVAWDELYSCDPHAHFFLSSDFIYAVAIRASGKFRILATWSDDDRLVGALPLLVTTKWSKTQHCLVNVLDMLGHVFDADYTGILCDPDFEGRVCEGFAAEVSGMAFRRIILNYYSGCSDRLARFTRAFDPEIFDTKFNEHMINNGQTDNLVCPYVCLPDSFQDYLASLSTNSRQKLRRLLRQLDTDTSLQVRKSRPETYPQDVAVLSKLWYLKHAQNKGHKRASQLAEAFKDVIMLGLANGTVYLAILYRDGKPIAAQANYLDKVKGQVLFHVGGRDDSVRDLSVGLMLQAHCIRWSIANKFRLYDFTTGNEPYKYSLGASDRKITSCEVRTRSGTNVSDRLDGGCRDEALVFIERYAKKGRIEDARTALRQAQAAWPTLALSEDIRALIAPRGDSTRGRH